MRSNFHNDLKKERRLSKLLDSYYHKYLLQYTTERTWDKNHQFSGIDIFFIHKQTKKKFFIDEKAQLDYINEDLPTFAFEINYLKNGSRRTGWFLDETKKTHFYALITGIYEDEPKIFTSCKITLVNREKLRSHMINLNLLKELLAWDNTKIIAGHGKIIVPQLNSKTQGYLYYSKNNKAEQPLNLILRLDYLLKEQIAKRLF